MGDGERGRSEGGGVAKGIARRGRPREGEGQTGRERETGIQEGLWRVDPRVSAAAAPAMLLVTVVVRDVDAHRRGFWIIG